MIKSRIISVSSAQNFREHAAIFIKVNFCILFSNFFLSLQPEFLLIVVIIKDMRKVKGHLIPHFSNLLVIDLLPDGKLFHGRPQQLRLEF
jgi:hypothetical protein